MHWILVGLPSVEKRLLVVRFVATYHATLEFIA